MRIPIRWLKEYVEIPITTEELAERLTMAGMEVAAIERIPSGELNWDGIVVGEVVAVEKHPNADRLSVARVHYGEGEQISVTGAPNIKPRSKGQRVAVAKRGARIVNAYATEPGAPPIATVEAATLRGVDSQIVLCSEKELGLSDEHGGVMLLDKDAPIGTALKDYLGDEVLEIELTPNLGRCLSIIGIAREVAAITGGKLSIKKPKWKTTEEPVGNMAKIEIIDADLCSRYSAAIIKNIKIKEAPFWMRYRLMLTGMRPINSVVDITNYTMLEWGQPLHAFDYDKLAERAGGKSPKIIIRRAKPGEKLVTLDNQERVLSSDMLLICDERGPVALAGVMGGLETEVSETSTTVLLEAASFHAINNRKTSISLLLPSEASQRFTKGVPSGLTEIGAMRAAELMRQISRGNIAHGLIDRYPRPEPDKIITLPLGEVERLLGLSLSPEEIIEILKRLEFKVRKQRDLLEVTVPYYRLDIEIPADLVEEIARVIGYDRLPSTLISERLPEQKRNHSQEIEERVRDILTGIGLYETINYSLTSRESLAKLKSDGIADNGAYVELANPISAERSLMRTTLMNGLLETVAANQRHQEQIALFEVGRVFLPNSRSSDGLPDEPARIGLVLAGAREESAWSAQAQPADFYDLKGVVEELLLRLGLINVAIRPMQHPTFHPGRTAEVSVGDVRLGILGEVHPQVTAHFDLKGKIYLAEIDLEALMGHSAGGSLYEPLPRFPGIRQDMAIVVDRDLAASRVEELIRQEGGDLLQDLKLFDVYTGEQVASGKKSLAYSLLYRAADRTLKDAEAQAVHLRIQSRVEQELNAQVRGIEN